MNDIDPAMNPPIDDWPFLRPSGKLKPANAAVVLIIDESGHYLMQLRDPQPTIFFPGHWGCFGGALDPGETPDQAARREVKEELSLELPPDPLVRFTNFTFDFTSFGAGIVNRTYFEVNVRSTILSSLTLGEGQEMRFHPAQDLLRGTVVPYDRFAIWMHHYRRELAGESS